jgi:antirestriction protein ArdC
MTRVRKICSGSQIRAGLSGYCAELGAAFLAADLGLAIEPRPDHASYLASWAKLWRGEHNFINREVSIM